MNVDSDIFGIAFGLFIIFVWAYTYIKTRKKSQNEV